MASPGEGLLRSDCKKVVSVLCHQEKARIRNQKFLELTVGKHRPTRKRKSWVASWKETENVWRKLKMPRFMLDSSIREDDVSFHIIKDYIERNHRVPNVIQEKHHLVEDYQQLFELYYTKPAEFYKVLSSAVDHLKINVLNHVAQIITGQKFFVEKTRAAMGKVVEENLPEILHLSASESSFHSDKLKQIGLILRDPVSFRKHLSIKTPVTPSLLLSIRKILEDLDSFPFICVAAMDRKINDVKIIPDIFSGANDSRERLLKRLRKRCDKILLQLFEGDELPKPLAKALSVITLYKKQIARCDDMPTTEFFPFTSKAEALQMVILKAIWLLPDFKQGKMKILQHLFDPGAKLSKSSFRSMMRKYLMEHLFETCEEDVLVPQSLLRSITFINTSFKPNIDFCKKSNNETGLENILNISSQFKQIAWDSCQDNGMEKYLKKYSVECDDADDVNDDILIDDYRKCSLYREPDASKCHSFLDVDAEIMDESQDFISVFKSPPQVYPHIHTNKVEQDADSCGNQPFPLTSSTTCQATGSNCDDSGGCSYDDIQTICDETSLLAHNLVSSLLEKFQGKRFAVENEKCTFLIQAVEELVLFISKRHLKNILEFLDPSQL